MSIWRYSMDDIFVTTLVLLPKAPVVIGSYQVLSVQSNFTCDAIDSFVKEVV